MHCDQFRRSACRLSLFTDAVIAGGTVYFICRRGTHPSQSYLQHCNILHIWRVGAAVGIVFVAALCRTGMFTDFLYRHLQTHHACVASTPGKRKEYVCTTCHWTGTGTGASTSYDIHPGNRTIGRRGNADTASCVMIYYQSNLKRSEKAKTTLHRQNKTCVGILPAQVFMIYLMFSLDVSEQIKNYWFLKRLKKLWCFW